MKLEIIKYSTVTSTNDVAMNLINNKKKQTGCVYSKFQTKGRGTKGKEWVSKLGNLFVSIFFPLKENYPPFNEFSIINPVIVSDLIRMYCKNKNISFKWPNDVFVNKKKICGILQEVITSDKNRFLIIGIGINVLVSPDIKKPYQATSIFLETGSKPSIEELANFLVLSYEKFFDNLNSYNFTKYKSKADLMAAG